MLKPHRLVFFPEMPQILCANIMCAKSALLRCLQSLLPNNPQGHLQCLLIGKPGGRVEKGKRRRRYNQLWKRGRWKLRDIWLNIQNHTRSLYCGPCSSGVILKGSLLSGSLLPDKWKWNFHRKSHLVVDLAIDLAEFNFLQKTLSAAESIKLPSWKTIQDLSLGHTSWAVLYFDSWKNKTPGFQAREVAWMQLFTPVEILLKLVMDFFFFFKMWPQRMGRMGEEKTAITCWNLESSCKRNNK